MSYRGTSHRDSIDIHLGEIANVIRSLAKRIRGLEANPTGAGSGGHIIKDEGVAVAQEPGLNFVGAGVTVTDDPVNHESVVTIGGGGGGGHVIQEEGVDLPAQPKLNFTGAGVVASDGPGAVTTVTIPGGGGAAHIIQDEGVALPAEPALNFIGPNVVVTDNAGVATDVTISDTPGAHHLTHENGGGDEINVAGLTGVLADDQNPVDHHLDHENGGGDEVNVGGLSGQLADKQPVAVRKNSVLVGTRPQINLIEGANVTLTVSDDAGDGEVDVTVQATSGSITTGGLDASEAWAFALIA